MTHSNIIASELKAAGFKTLVTSFGVKVSLGSRKVSTLEVWYALDKLFEDIQFNIQSLTDSVLVK